MFEPTWIDFGRVLAAKLGQDAAKLGQVGAKAGPSKGILRLCWGILCLYWGKVGKDLWQLEQNFIKKKAVWMLSVGCWLTEQIGWYSVGVHGQCI